MKIAIRKGFSFGLTSAVITTLGIIVGLSASTQSKVAVIGGILSIAIADAFADALGIHISEESELNKSPKTQWIAALSAFSTKLIFALTFILPIIFLNDEQAIIISLIWGLGLLSIFSYYLAKKQKIRPWQAIAEHVLIAIVVITITHLVGQWIRQFFI
jgi:VIT1/CCC1 family predicted Fe2+/Mn2+ transporter